MITLDSILHFLNRLVPKDPQQAFFSTTCIYRDNICSVLEEFLRHPESRAFRIVLDGTGLVRYRGNNIQHVRHKSWASVWQFLRSKYVLYDNGLYGSRSVVNQVSVNTWHGIGLKRIGYHTSPARKGNQPTATHVIAYSPQFVDVMAYAFGVSPRNVIVTGDPRSDYLFTMSDSLAAFGVERDEYDRVIMWMPTYRDSLTAESKSDGASYQYGIPLLDADNIGVLDEHLRHCRTLLIVKYHSLQHVSLPTSRLQNIRFLTSRDVMESGEPLYALLSKCDALVTDYSSVFLNYLVLNRPVCFAFDDLEVYAGKRGFMFENVESMMPGFKARSLDQLLEFIDDLSRGIDDYRVDRVDANRRFNTYQDNRNAYRLLAAIGMLG